MKFELVRLKAADLAGRFARARAAVTAIEYALIASLIAVAIIGALTTLGTSISSTFAYVAAQL